MEKTDETLAKKAAEALDAKKAENVRVYDVRGISDVTDWTVVATGTSAPHLKALIREAEGTLADEGAERLRISGEPDSGWVVLDAITVVVHVFSEEARTYYDIEKLWTKRPEEVDAGEAVETDDDETPEEPAS